MDWSSAFKYKQYISEESMIKLCVDLKENCSNKEVIEVEVIHYIC